VEGSVARTFGYARQDDAGGRAFSILNSNELNGERQGWQTPAMKRRVAVMTRGEPHGWNKVRVPKWLFGVVRRIGDQLLDSHVNRRGELPARFVDRAKTADHYVLARALHDYASHRARCTTGTQRKTWIDICHEIAKEARLGPFGESER
jgi:hypothetical protein